MNWWEIKNLSEKEGEILIYGDITDWKWDESDVTASDFDKKLKALGDVETIKVRVNSYGGSVFQAAAIRNMLYDHSARVVAIVEGIAASAASYIITGADEIQVHENSMIMIHNPATVAWGDAKELIKAAEMLEKVEITLIAAYKEKTGKTEAELDKMMEDETWMTGKEAVEEGFADTLLEPVAMVASGKKLVAAGIEFDLTKFSKKPPIEEVAARAPEKKPEPENISAVKNEVGGKNMTLEELKAAHPDLCAQIEQEAAETAQAKERDRIKAIEDVAVAGSEKMVEAAKFTEPISAEQLAMNIIKAQKEKGQQVLNATNKDAEQLNDVKGSTPEEDKQQEDEIVNAIVEGANKKGGAK